MAEATRTEAREVTERHTAESLDYLKPGDRVVEDGMFQVIVERTATVPGKVTLELTELEAQTLADILSRVGGQPATSRRKFAASMSEALQSVGLNYGRRGPRIFGELSHAPDLEGSPGLRFSDGPDDPYDA